MVDELKMGFFTAFSISSTLCITNSGHHIIPVNKPYPFYQGNLNKKEDASFNKFNLKNSRALYMFVNGGDSKESIIKEHTGFDVHNTLRKLFSNDIMINRNDLLKESVEKVLKGEQDAL